MSYVHYPPVGVEEFNSNINVATYGFPDDWMDIYFSKRLYECDPLARKASVSIYPFFWGEALSMPDLTPREQEFLELVQTMDLGVGVAVPVFGPLGRNGFENCPLIRLYQNAKKKF